MLKTAKKFQELNMVRGFENQFKAFLRAKFLRAKFLRTKFLRGHDPISSGLQSKAVQNNPFRSKAKGSMVAPFRMNNWFYYNSNQKRDFHGNHASKVMSSVLVGLAAASGTLESTLPDEKEEEGTNKDKKGDPFITSEISDDDKTTEEESEKSNEKDSDGVGDKEKEALLEDEDKNISRIDLVLVKDKTEKGVSDESSNETSFLKMYILPGWLIRLFGGKNDDKSEDEKYEDDNKSEDQKDGSDDKSKDKSKDEKSEYEESEDGNKSKDEKGDNKSENEDNDTKSKEYNKRDVNTTTETSSTENVCHSLTSRDDESLNASLERHLSDVSKIIDKKADDTSEIGNEHPNFNAGCPAGSHLEEELVELRVTQNDSEGSLPKFFDGKCVGDVKCTCDCEYGPLLVCRCRCFCLSVEGEVQKKSSRSEVDLALPAPILLTSNK